MSDQTGRPAIFTKSEAICSFWAFFIMDWDPIAEWYVEILMINLARHLQITVDLCNSDLWIKYFSAIDFVWFLDGSFGLNLDVK